MNAFATRRDDFALIEARHNGATDFNSTGGRSSRRRSISAAAPRPLFTIARATDAQAFPFPGGMSADPTSVDRVARAERNVRIAADAREARRARAFDPRIRFPRRLQTGVAAGRELVSPRMAMTRRGTALIESIQYRDPHRAGGGAGCGARAAQRAQPADGSDGWLESAGRDASGVHGDAFRTELGLRIHRANDLVRGCGIQTSCVRSSTAPVPNGDAFMDSLNPPAPTAACLASPARRCSRPSDAAACILCDRVGGNSERLYSDLLLHDMVRFGRTTISMVRRPAVSFAPCRCGACPSACTPARRAREHDRRRTSPRTAVRRDSARQAFDALSAPIGQAVLDYLNCI